MLLKGKKNWPVVFVLRRLKMMMYFAISCCSKQLFTFILLLIAGLRMLWKRFRHSSMYADYSRLSDAEVQRIRLCYYDQL